MVHIKVESSNCLAGSIPVGHQGGKINKLKEGNKKRDDHKKMRPHRMRKRIFKRNLIPRATKIAPGRTATDRSDERATRNFFRRESLS